MGALLSALSTMEVDSAAIEALAAVEQQHVVIEIPRPLRRPGLDFDLDVGACVAPMVNQSDSAFRRLCRRHGASLAYTQMYLAEAIVNDVSLRAAAIAACETDNGGPLLVQLAGNDPALLVKAGLIMAPYCHGIDLNLGCPQERAEEGRYGSYITYKKDWPLVESIISAMASHLPVPVTAKIRLQDSVEESVEFAKLIAKAGARMIAVHGRKRGSAQKRRVGPARLDWVKAIVDALPDIPIVSNGNVRCHADVHAALEATGAAGVMSAEGILEDPGLFACGPECAAGRPRSDKPGLKQACRLINAYLDEVEATQDLAAKSPIFDVQHHIAYMLGKAGKGDKVRYRFQGPFRTHCNVKAVLFQDDHTLGSLRDFVALFESAVE